MSADKPPKYKFRAFLGGALIGVFLSIVPFWLFMAKTALEAVAFTGALSGVLGCLATFLPERRYEAIMTRIMAVLSF